MEQLLSEMIPLASRRGGGTTWEYYFNFDGGAPPWTSAMSQATGLEALSRAYLATKNPYYLQVAASAMAVFGKPPPVGVTVPTTLGVRFLQYTFAPSLLIINADLQTLIGLYAYALRSAATRPHRRCSRRATPRRWPSCRASTPARGRCIRRASRTT